MVSIPKGDILALIGKYLVGLGEERLAKKIFKLSGHTAEDSKVAYAAILEASSFKKETAEDHQALRQ